MTRIHFLLLLDRLEELITKRPRIFGRTLVVVDDLLELLDNIRMTLPPEVKKADEIIGEREEYLRKSKEEAEKILRQARIEANKLLAEHVILKQATAEAKSVKEKADEYSREVKEELNRYVQQVLSKIEDNLIQALKVIHKTKDEFSKRDGE